MNKYKLGFILALIAGALSLGNFVYKWLTYGTLDYVILAAGVFILAFGIGIYTRRA